MVEVSKVARKPDARPAQHVKHEVKQAQQGHPNESKDFRGIIRIMGRDLQGHLKLRNALRKIRGVGHNLGVSLLKIISKETGISPDFEVGDLNDDQIAKIEDVLKNPSARDIRPFLLNRSIERASGKPAHFVATDLQFAVKQDVSLEKDLRSWRGWRHSIGQKVRGQHTRSTGRTGMTVGVLKKALKVQKAAAASGAQDASKDKK